MALHLNLLHEEILGAIMVLYYLWNAYQVLGIRNRLEQAQHDWAKVEPKVTGAQKRSAELNGIISTTKVLDGIIDSRFYWGPFLEKLSRCVALNAQVTSVDGSVLDDGKIAIVIEGLAAGREPRAAAEELRQLLLEQLGKSNYSELKVEFKTLEDLDTIVNIGGSNMAMSRFAINATFSTAAAKPSATPGARTKKQ